MSGEPRTAKYWEKRVLRRWPCSVISDDTESVKMRTEKGPLDLPRRPSVTLKIITVSRVVEARIKFQWPKGKNEAMKEILAGRRNQGRPLGWGIIKQTKETELLW